MPRPTRLHGVRAARADFGAKHARFARAAVTSAPEFELIRVIARESGLPDDDGLLGALDEISRRLDRAPEHTPSGMAADLRALKQKVLRAQQDHVAALSALRFTERLLGTSPYLSRTHITLLTVEGVLLDLVEPIENLRALRQKLRPRRHDDAAARETVKFVKKLLEDSPSKDLPQGIVQPPEDLKSRIDAVLSALDHEIELLGKEGAQGKRADQRQRRAAMLLLHLFVRYNRSPRKAWLRARKFITGALNMLHVSDVDFGKHPERLIRLLRPVGHP